MCYVTYPAKQMQSKQSPRYSREWVTQPVSSSAHARCIGANDLYFFLFYLSFSFSNALIWLFATRTHVHRSPISRSFTGDHSIDPNAACSNVLFASASLYLAEERKKRKKHSDLCSYVCSQYSVPHDAAWHCHIYVRDARQRAKRLLAV